MQIVDKNNVERRILFYWSKSFSQSIKAGNDYNMLKRTIAILISDYNLENLKGIPKYMTKWNLREEKYPYIILTDALEIYIIELEKVKEFMNEGNFTLNSWLQFINNPEEKLDMENKEIKKAKEILEEISGDEHERRLAELREKHILDQKATEAYGYDKGFAAGIEQGIEKGIEQGIEKNQIQTIKNMKAENFDIATISKIIGLSEKEIKEILAEE